jgi:Raf kinase inhibitor-like YbhB/YbcL family protein
MPDFELSSDSFDHGEPIPVRHTCSGEDRSPRLAWSLTPEGTRSLALLLHDPDAPSGDFVHWLVWNINPGDDGIEEGAAAPREGTNGFGNLGYSGPCPPPGVGPHRYFFRLYALDTELDLEAGATRDKLEDAIEGHALAEAELMGTFERAG